FENPPSEAWLLPSEGPRRTLWPEPVSVSRSRSRSKSTCAGKTGHGCRDARRKSSPGTCIAAPHAVTQSRRTQSRRTASGEPKHHPRPLPHQTSKLQLGECTQDLSRPGSRGCNQEIHMLRLV